MTCYLILDFRPTYFSYFQKIIAISHSHNVKKEVDPKDPFPVVKGLIGSLSYVKNFIVSKKDATILVMRYYFGEFFIFFLIFDNFFQNFGFG